MTENRYAIMRAGWIARVECLLTTAAVLWLQVVGVVTHTVVHHVLHAAPLAVLIILPRKPWVRHTAALAGFVWILMLAVATPMLHLALIEGTLFQQQPPAYAWLAPVMALICAGWSASNIAILRRSPRTWGMAFLTLVAITLALTALRPWVGAMYEIPLEHVLAGRVIWLLPLLLEVPLTLIIPWLVVRYLTKPPRPTPTGACLAWQAAYWLGFLACMILGLLPALNRTP